MYFNRFRASGLLFGITLFPLLLASSAVHAQVIVLQSTATAYKAGRTLGRDVSIDLPSGGSMVVVLASGATRTISGPFKGKVSSLSKSGSSNAALFNAVKRFVKTGGATTKSIGALRSIASNNRSVARATTPPPPFSWDAVPIAASGDLCVARNGLLRITRQRASGPLTFTLIDLQSSQRVKLQFPPGVRELPWPAELQPKNGAFAFLPQGGKMRQLRMRLISPLPAAERTLQVLHGQRCQMQFAAFLRGLAVSQKQ